MDIKEKGQLTEDQEFHHWWIQTRFLYIDRALSRLVKGSAFPAAEGFDVIEFGCGTGQNVRFLREESAFAHRINRVRAVDPELPPGFRPGRATENDLFLQDTGDTGDTGEKSHFLLAMDVLEHIDDDICALRGWTEHLHRGAIVLITVPAFQFLWSGHDEFLEHKRRYTGKSLRKCAAAVGLQPVSIRYAFGYVFPLVVLERKLISRKTRKDETTSDLKVHSPLVNGVLKTLGKWEDFMGGNPLLGTSVVGIFRLP
ncbi:MAG: class I SAM-dependent methyltransferase [bacterium]|nr:class I SAM-dependent methyltransferase [bacterium]